jgi:glyoxylase-like metal-dependent hydrolase (beta-lactamase superfamily II)
MRSTEHGDRLIQLTRLGCVNCYLVREEDGLTLIDTGLPHTAPGILAAAAAAGGSIARIALTHAHGDHVGSLDVLRGELPDAEVSISARDARFLAGDKTLDEGEPMSKLRGGYPQVETRPDRKLSAGDRVGSLEVLACPGHTPGHVAFLDTRDRTLIAGDALQTLGGIAVAGVLRPLFPLPAMATWDLPTALQSARALRALDPARLAVGHGRVVEAPATEMDKAIAAAERKLSTT